MEKQKSIWFYLIPFIFISSGIVIIIALSFKYGIKWQKEIDIKNLQIQTFLLKQREMFWIKNAKKHEFWVTAYLSIDEKEKRFSGYTFLGLKAVPGYTCAVDPKRIPLGSWVYIIELERWYRAVDTGNAIKGNIIDICVETREIAEEFGKKKFNIIILY